MLVDAAEFQHGSEIQADIAIIGAGAAGIALALDLAEAGLESVLIESGGPGYSSRVQALAGAVDLDAETHPTMDECTRRQVGGTSAIWGGRVVPFDPVDFDDRAYIPHSRWPIAYEDAAKFYPRACAFLNAGAAEFDIHNIPGVPHPGIVPGLPDEEVLSSTLERWSVVNAGVIHGEALRASTKIRVIHSLTCVEIECAPGATRVASIRARTLAGAQVRIRARRYILTTGGLNTTRLLLESDRVHAGGIGNHSDNLGRYYSGHISGRIAEARFTTDPRKTAYGFYRDADGVHVRQRLSFARTAQHKHELGNISSWLVNPDLSDPSHGNGVLSFAYLVLSSPMGRFLASEAIRKSAIKGAVRGSAWTHIANMIRDLPRTAVFIPTFGYGRFLAQRKTPGFYQYSKSNSYPLHYFGEQVPNPESRVTLSAQRDELGMRRIRIDHRYSQQDVDYVLKAHRVWDDHLQRHGKGRLHYLADDLPASVWDQAGDGFHQVGTTRMSENPRDGVVDARCRVHGFDDLFIASSSAFVTSSQANSMLTILALTYRVGEFLKAEAARG